MTAPAEDEDPLVTLRQQLGSLHRSAGQPSYATLGRQASLAGDRLPTSTIHTLLNGPGRPRWGSVRVFVAACERYARSRRDLTALPPEAVAMHRWQQLHHRLGEQKPAAAAATKVATAATVDGWPALRPVCETNPRLLGVHAPIDAPAADTALPAYIERDVDRQADGLRARLQAAAERGGMVLLIGGASVGKSRSAFEAALAVLPEWPLFHPDPADPGDMAVLGTVPGRPTLIWLDELQRYLDRSDLPPRALRRLVTAETPVVVLATMWADRYVEHLATAEAGDERGRDDRAILDLAEVIHLDEAFSDPERERATTLSATDPRIRLALQTRRHGVTQAIAAAPQLLRRWQSAPVYARAVLDAAIDAARLGAQAALPAEYLRTAAVAYCAERHRANAPSDWFETALKYCGQVMRGAAAVLEPVGERMGATRGYVVADYVVELASRAHRQRRVPPSTWQALAGHVREPNDLRRLGYSAEKRLLFGHAISLYTEAAIGGDGLSAIHLAQIYQRHGELEAAVGVLRPFARRTDDFLAVKLVDLLAERGELDELRDRAAAGDDYAVFVVADLLVQHGRAGEAEKLLRARLAAGHDVVTTLARVLDGQDRTEEALELLRAHEEGDGLYVREGVARLLAKTGRTAELRQRAEAGDEVAYLRWLKVLAEQGEVAELRERAGRGDEAAAVHLALALSGGGQYDEALGLLQGLSTEMPQTVPAGLHDPESLRRAARQAAPFLIKNVGEQARLAGEIAIRSQHIAEMQALQERYEALQEQAGPEGVESVALSSEFREIHAALEDVQQRSAAVGANGTARDRAGRSPVPEEDAIDRLVRDADAGDRDAAGHLAHRLAERGDLDRLRLRVQAGDETAADKLIEVMRARGRERDADRLERFGFDDDGAIVAVPDTRPAGRVGGQRQIRTVGNGLTFQMSEEGEISPAQVVALRRALGRHHAG